MQNAAFKAEGDTASNGAHVSASKRRGGPVDPRLVAYTRSTRRYLMTAVGLGILTATLVVAQAWLIADTVSGAFLSHRGLHELEGPLAALLLVVVARSVVAWGSERAAQRASARAKSDLRNALVARVAVRGPAGPEVSGAGELAVLATTGIDALDAYFSRYLPQVFLAVIVPVTILAVVVGLDWLSALIIVVTLPLIPLFMALVGATARDRAKEQVETVERLAGYFLDVVAGLPTLRVFGRARGQAAAIRQMTDRYRQATMSTLRVAFLSSLILELLATMSVALVAVAVGLRLLGGHMEFRTALFVLVLAPEAYLPLRLLGTNYHASTEGMEAAAQVFEVLDAPVPVRGTRTDIPDTSAAGLEVCDLVVTYPGRSSPALDRVRLWISPGEAVAVVGPSGCGKSTLLSVLLGCVAPTSGGVSVGGVDLSALDPDCWRARVAWVPQRPHLFAATVADNIRLGRRDATREQLDRAVSDAGLDEVVARLPEGLGTRLGDDGAGLSAGERQRVALARAFLRDSPLLLLDEPTANLDGRTEEAVVEAVGRLLRGRTAVVVAHRPALLSVVDRVVDLSAEGACP